MKRLFWLFALVVLLVAISTPPQRKVGDCMAFRTANTSLKSYLSWPNNYGAFTNVTIMLWLKRLSIAQATQGVALWDGTGSDTDQGLAVDMYDSGSGSKVQFWAHFSTTDGVWTASSLSAGVLYHIAVTYTGTTTAPLIYVNGASQTVAVDTAPSGTFRTGTNNNFILGSDYDGARDQTDFYSTLFYNRIFTPDEIMSAYNSKLMIPDWRGLVFAPDLCKAASLQTFDGATLSGTNYVVDQVSGAQGTPSGSPVGYADTYLTVRGY